ncbi:Flp family type IVb pilin [Methylopila sp. Yamaguchi]|uniref:Flp family type IVb pilin n=1 Tax=Methylopila sp. Yamaguchi TaxID=1437817 RepID=UPI000CBCD068|nr:Flp family type IVb pilin [Methylopila sp. Yamaguchi]GBD50321.1 hypothetical protein METY_3534 [Methylopila sp. Yamaguchi]
MARRVLDALRRFARDDRGATAIEYAMIAMGIAVAISGAVYALGETVLSGYFNHIADEYKKAAGG